MVGLWGSWESPGKNWVGLRWSWVGLRPSWEGLVTSCEGVRASWEGLGASWEGPRGDGEKNPTTTTKIITIVSIIIILLRFLDFSLMVICSHFGSQGKGPFCALRYLKCSDMKLGPQLYHFSDQWEEKPYSIHPFERSSIRVISGL